MTMSVDEHVTMDDGVRLWVSTTGSGPPVVLCHGGPGMADYLEPVSEALTDLATVHRWDQRGAGRSGPDGPFSIERSVADLEGVRTHFGHDSWVLVGHSWGANLAILYAQRHPQRVAGIVYVCGTGLEWWPVYTRVHKENQRARLDGAMGQRLRELHGKERNDQEQHEYEWLYLLTEFADRDRAPELASLVHDHDRRYPVNQEANRAINADLRSLAIDEQREACRRIAVPVLVVDCLGDPRPPAANDSLVAALPVARRMALDGCGHFPWLEDPDAFQALVRPFVAEVLVGSHL